MPAINIPQDEQSMYGTLLNFRQRRATADYTEAQADLTNANARLDTQSADYYDKTGTSKASQEEEKINVDKQKLTQQLQAYQLELRKQNNTEALQKFNILTDAAAAVQAASANNPKMSNDDKETLWQGLLHAGGIADEAQTHGLMDLPDDNHITALAQISGKQQKTTEVGVRTIGTDANGKEITAQIEKDDQGNLFTTRRTPNGMVRQPLPGANMGMPTQKTQQVPADEAGKLREQAQATADVLDNATEIAKILKATPDANTFVGEAGQLINNIEANTQAAARQMGIQFNLADSVFDPKTYSKEFKQFGIQSARLQAFYMNLAFQAAIASGQGKNSISDRDIPRFKEIIGEASQSPEAALKTLQDYADLSVRRFNNARGFTPDIQWGRAGDPSEELQKRYENLQGIISGKGGGDQPNVPNEGAYGEWMTLPGGARVRRTKQ